MVDGSCTHFSQNQGLISAGEGSQRPLDWGIQQISGLYGLELALNAGCVVLISIVLFDRVPTFVLPMYLADCSGTMFPRKIGVG